MQNRRTIGDDQHALIDWRKTIAVDGDAIFTGGHSRKIKLTFGVCRAGFGPVSVGRAQSDVRTRHRTVIGIVHDSSDIVKNASARENRHKHTQDSFVDHGTPSALKKVISENGRRWALIEECEKK